MGKHSNEVFVEIEEHAEARLEITGINTATHCVDKGFPVNVLQGPKCAIFDFPDSPEIRKEIQAFERGCSTRHLLEIRSWLYKEASSIMKRGPRHD